MLSLEKLKRHFRVGQVYRRADLVGLSTNLDRHLRRLVDDGVVKKLRGGIYYKPKKSVFGDVPPEEQKVLASFLKSDDFLVMSLNSYNALRLGTTQLYNERLVYNHKRNGRMQINGQNYFFLETRRFPKKVSEAFLLVDLINNINMLAEDIEKLKQRVAQRASALGIKKIHRTAKRYGKPATQRFFERVMSESESADVAP